MSPIRAGAGATGEAAEGQNATWFSPDDLKARYPSLRTLQAKEDVELAEHIETATSWVEGAVSSQFTTPPDELLGVAYRFARNLALGSDENVLIARARGQASFTVSGEAMTIDLTRNPYLDIADVELVARMRKDLDGQMFTDKVVVRSQGTRYEDAVQESDASEYVRPDSTRLRPTYLYRRAFTGQ